MRALPPICVLNCKETKPNQKKKRVLQNEMKPKKENWRHVKILSLKLSSVILITLSKEAEEEEEENDAYKSIRRN